MQRYYQQEQNSSINVLRQGREDFKAFVFVGAHTSHFVIQEHPFPNLTDVAFRRLTCSFVTQQNLIVCCGMQTVNEMQHWQSAFCVRDSGEPGILAVRHHKTLDVVRQSTFP
jgi:hypothetical protein